MSHEPLDPRRDKLVSALYGELTAEEEQALMALISQDEELRSEWEDLRGARAFLKRSDVEDPAPSFVFLPPVAGDSHPREPVGFWDRLRSFVLSPSGALAAVAAALVILVVSGFRIDKVDNGVAFRFGTPVSERSPASSPGDFAQKTPATVPYRPTGGARSMPPASGSTGSAPGVMLTSDAYPTRDELLAQRNDLMTMMAIMLKNYDQKHNDELGFLLKEVYEDVMEKQQKDYTDLKSQIERVGLGFVFDRDASGDLEPLIKKGQRYELRPVAQPVIENGEVNNNE